MLQGLNVFICSFLVLLVCSCQPEGGQFESLQKVHQTIDADPAQALQMLENVPAIDLLEKDGQMQYVVLLTQAKYMNRQDITEYSQILEAQRYFSDKDPEMAARASYYTAAYWHAKADEPQALEYALLAHDFAKQAENNLFIAKSAHWIGSTYYDQDQLDSAKIYYKISLEVYNLMSNTEISQLDLLNFIGKIYFDQQDLEEAFKSFNKGLKLANELDNDKFKAIFEYSIGLIFRENGDFQHAKDYFKLALSKKPDQEDSLRIYLSYARLYKAMDQPDSMIHYLDQVKNRVSEITYPYTRRAIYQELAFYYEKEGDVVAKSYYEQKAKEEDFQIAQLQNKESIRLVNKLFSQYQTFECLKKKLKTDYLKTIKVGLIVLVTQFFLGLIFWADKQFFKRKFKEAYQEKQFHLMDFQRFLLVGMRQFAKSREAILEDPAQPVDKAQAEKELLQVQMNFNIELARQAKEMISQRMPPEAQALLDTFSTDDWCNIQLSRYYCEKEVTRLMGYEPKFEFYIIRRKQELRKQLEEAGLDQEAIRYFFMQEPVKTS